MEKEHPLHGTALLRNKLPTMRRSFERRGSAGDAETDGTVSREVHTMEVISTGMHNFSLFDPKSDRMQALQRTMAELDIKKHNPHRLRTRSNSSPASLFGAHYPALKEKQAKEICSTLTIREKVGLCSGRDMWYLKSVRDKLSAVLIADGPHGVRKQEAGNSTDFVTGRVPATCFPTASCLACSWDTSLLKKMGVALGRECVKHDVTVLLGPGVNIKRHPCGGRNFEYFSEDPHLSGHLASGLIEGIQSQGVGTSIKHFCVNNEEWVRMRLDVQVDERTLREIYWRAFEIAIRDRPPQQQPWTVMCAYNKLNGTYCSEHEGLWTMLRKEWGFTGIVMTDWGATNERVKGLMAGCDLEMPGSQGAYDSQLKDAVKNGNVPMDTLDATVTRNLQLSLIGQDIMDILMEVDLDAHHELARKVAMESAVLLKNDDAILPLAKNTSIAVIGNFAKQPRYQGMGSSQVFPTQLDCAWDRLGEYTNKLVYASGYNRDNDTVNKAFLDGAVEAARTATVAIIFCGLPESYESEGFDRPHMGMPASHDALIEAVCAVNTKTTVVLSNGAPVAMPWVDKPAAILESYLGGQAGGSAVADLLFGVASPCGKLAETFPLDQRDHASDLNFPGQNYQVQYREGLNVGYRHFDTAKLPVLFPFGHGLTYTKFEYRHLRTIVLREHKVLVILTVRNVGPVRAAEIVQCYVHDAERSVYRPEHELQAFSKVWLDPGEAKEIKMTLDERAFSFYDVGAQGWIVEPGSFEIRVGASSRAIHLQTTVELSDGVAPTERARHTYPPVKYQIGAVSDEQFARMLAVESLPRPRRRGRPFHNNTLMGELKRSILGRILRHAVYKGALKGMEDPDDKLQRKLMAEICENVPMRALVIFSQGGLTFEELKLMLSLMNGNLIKVCGQGYPVLKERRRRLRATNY